MRQMACKPGSVPRLRGEMAIPLGRPSPDASRDRPGRQPGNGPCAVPIWSCSRWGLPCRVRCRARGALLPHRFTLARLRPFRGKGGRFLLCGAIPGVAPAGRYPAPYLRGARTFLQPQSGQRPSSHLTRRTYNIFETCSERLRQAPGQRLQAHEARWCRTAEFLSPRDSQATTVPCSRE